ncbi:MAG: DNA methylase [Firmicutes bacterium]|nr:DNA methylase [Bacillota bacterium]
MERTYIAIDLKSFYASVECVDRSVDPLVTNLVVADPSRSEKTICLAVSPALKRLGVPGRPRLFEVIQQVDRVNEERRQRAPHHQLSGASWYEDELQEDPVLRVDYIVAPPRMARYMEVSAQIYRIYLKYASEDDIHVYSIDEVFIDATAYLHSFQITARDYATRIVRDIIRETGITATVGIGTNLYLCKIAMDIVAKHMPPDETGMRIAELDEQSYREKLWLHRPLTDFWRIGGGYRRKLEAHGMYTMGDVALCSVGQPGEYHNPELLYKLFGINAELLIDHAWGREPCTMADIKSYRPESRSLSTGQVLPEPYEFDKGRIVVREMTELLVLDLVDKMLRTDQMVLTVCYDTDFATDDSVRARFDHAIRRDYYGREVPEHAHGSVNLGRFTSSGDRIVEAVVGLYDRIVDPGLHVRRMFVVANHIHPESAPPPISGHQIDLFSEPVQEEDPRERSRQRAILRIQKKYGKNSILKGTNLLKGATTIERNSQIGGHKA